MAGSNTKKKTTASGKHSREENRGTEGTTAAKRTGAKKQEADSSFLQSEAVILGTFAVCVFLFLSNFHICGVSPWGYVQQHAPGSVREHRIRWRLSFYF